ncbi:hypothetical protein WM29_22925 [Burkholderia ubonensis]|uniref:hypothetical protein n=1 Tax=Burkholderia ubonensis TaxID=101571 RepID=UPI000841F900|nr:hypothetical protein [Burkholderia ubonensis]AOK61984.1 hypothetical protein WM29_22925 [Burkholderia ubonensis]
MTDDVNKSYYEMLQSLDENSRSLGFKESNMIIRAIQIQTRILDNTQRTTQLEITQSLRDIQTQISELHQMLQERSSGQ